MGERIRVAINGYGTIGKRVAFAVAAQDDMVVVGVTKTRPGAACELAERSGLPMYCAIPDAKRVAAFHEAGYRCGGTIDDLLASADIVVDCSPGEFGADNLARYQAAGMKYLFQGGESHALTGLSYTSSANHEENLGVPGTRVVSCNTTGLARTLVPVSEAVDGPLDVTAVMIRRAADPGDSKKGPINAITPVLKVPSHHGPDLITVAPHIQIQSLAVAVPTTIMHVHAMTVRLPAGHGLTSESVVEMWRQTPRVIVRQGGHTAISSTAQVMEMARDMGRRWSDLYEIFVWEEGVSVQGDVLYCFQAIHQESDVVPENVDAVRAVMATEADWRASVARTDAALQRAHGLA